MDQTWQELARSLRAQGESITAIARTCGVSKDRVQRAIDPTYAAKRAAQVRARRAQQPERSDMRCRPRRPEIIPTEKTVVRERCDGTRISLPRVLWLERQMPDGHSLCPR